MQRTIIACVVLVGVTALVIAHYSDANLALAIGVYGTVLGYVFGRTNGEKALAREMIKAMANAKDPAVPAVDPVHVGAAIEAVTGHEVVIPPEPPK